jgi:hypothetical protein
MVVALLSLLLGSAELDEAVKLVDDTRFEEAIPRLKALVYAKGLSRADLNRGREALARSYFYTQQTTLARDQLTLLFRSARNYKVDRNLPPDYLEFFDTVAAEANRPIRSPTKVEKNEPTAEEPRAAPAKPEQSSAPIAAPTTTARVEPGAPWYLKILPFGGGQFANHDPVGGGVFLGLEVALLGANIALLVANNGLIAKDGSYPHKSQSLPLYVSQQVTAAAFYATLAIGLIDAFVWSPSRGASRAAVSVAPGGAGFAF